MRHVISLLALRKVSGLSWSGPIGFWLRCLFCCQNGKETMLIAFPHAWSGSLGFIICKVGFMKVPCLKGCWEESVGEDTLCIQKHPQHWLVSLVIIVMGSRHSCHPLGTGSLSFNTTIP